MLEMLGSGVGRVRVVLCRRTGLRYVALVAGKRIAVDESMSRSPSFYLPQTRDITFSKAAIAVLEFPHRGIRGASVEHITHCAGKKYQKRSAE